LIAIESWVAGIRVQQKNVAALTVAKVLLPAELEERIHPVEASQVVSNKKASRNKVD
jgi:hypothetical protein